MSFKDLKNKFKDKTAMDKIKSRIEEESGGGYEDDRYWKFTVDSSGNGMAIIRFLPEPEGEDFPYVTYYEHIFQNEDTKKWYINRSLTSLGKGVPDPVSELNNHDWNNGGKAGKERARRRRRQQKYVSNIYVIKDKNNPENEGKVFLFKYTPSIHKIIQLAINPPDEYDEEPINPYDMWNGADFKLKSFYDNDKKYRSYEKSSFTEPKPLLDGDDEKLEEIYNQLYSLEAEVSDDKYKSYDELKKWLDVVEGKTSDTNATNDDGEDDDAQKDDDDDYDEPTASSSDEDDDDDYLKYLGDDD